MDATLRAGKPLTGTRRPPTLGSPALPRWPGGLAGRFAAKLDGRHPVIVFAVALAAGFALVAALSIALGLLVTDVLLQSGGVASADESFVESLAGERTPFLTDVSAVGSTVGSTLLVAIAVLAALFFAHRRRWGLAAFAILLPAVESGLYRITSTAAPRERPDVPRLEDLPVDASYPSGHVGASIAVYGGLALVLATRIANPAWRFLVFAAAALVAAFVALSRMYRGMHHPIDAGAGLVIGLAAIAVVLFACRAACAAKELRHARPSSKEKHT
jgi:membrane-associated phospholipid phosphatase